MKDILIAARAKIADQTNWTQHALARDINGDDRPASHPLANHIHWEGLDGRDPQACKWCALGAVQAVTTNDSEFRKARDALENAAYELFSKHNIADVNDDTEEDPALAHLDVLKCYDHAIKAAA